MSNLIGNNIRILRKQLSFTQEQLAEKIGIKRSLIGAYEEGRAEPRLNTLQRMADLFSVSVDLLIGHDFATHRGQMPDRQEGSPLRVLSITLDKNDRENIELVPQKAAAGYLNGYADPEYIEELPRFQLPFLPANQTYRAFEISGDSMLPLQPGTIVIGSYVDDVRQIKNGHTYIVMSQQEGVVYKRIYKTDDPGQIRLVSDNTVFEPYNIQLGEVIELWEARAFISQAFPDPGATEQLSLQKIAGIVMDLQKEVIKLKDR
ncbi:MAG: LexA family transcriptional regulator [Cyclobacteriaceae bacterium]|nr:LexA family transcriptional regulator [Cyclobacteriaceae bacterium]